MEGEKQETTAGRPKRSFEEFIAACEAIVQPLREAVDQVGLTVRAESVGHWLVASRLRMYATVFWASEPFAALSVYVEPEIFEGFWDVRPVGVPVDIEGRNLTSEEATVILMRRLAGHLVYLRQRASYLEEAKTALSRLQERMPSRAVAFESLR